MVHPIRKHKTNMEDRRQQTQEEKMKPTKKEIIEQLESLKDNSESFIYPEAEGVEPDPANEIWKKDVEVLEIVIKFVKEKYEDTDE